MLPMLCFADFFQALLAEAEARLAGVRAKSGWPLRLALGLASSFVGRIVRNLTVTVSTVALLTLIGRTCVAPS